MQSGLFVHQIINERELGSKLDWHAELTPFRAAIYLTVNDFLIGDDTYDDTVGYRSDLRIVVTVWTDFLR